MAKLRDGGQGDKETFGFGSQGFAEPQPWACGDFVNGSRGSEVLRRSDGAIDEQLEVSDVPTLTKIPIVSRK